jgi:hypothetical protein
MDDDTVLDKDALFKAAQKRLIKAFAPQIKTGTCGHCGEDIFNRRADARFCSNKCRVAACRKALPPPATREIQRLKAENARLEALVQHLKAEKAPLEPLVQHLPSTGEERRLAAEAKQAKLRRDEERGKRALQRRGVSRPVA